MKAGSSPKSFLNILGCHYTSLSPALKHDISVAFSWLYPTVSLWSPLATIRYILLEVLTVQSIGSRHQDRSGDQDITPAPFFRLHPTSVNRLFTNITSIHSRLSPSWSLSILAFSRFCEMTLTRGSDDLFPVKPQGLHPSTEMASTVISLLITIKPVFPFWACVPLPSAVFQQGLSLASPLG